MAEIAIDPCLPPPLSSTSSFLRSACSCYLSGICRYTDAPNTAGVTQTSCSGHILGPIWVFQVHNALVVNYSLGSQHYVDMHTHHEAGFWKALNGPATSITNSPSTTHDVTGLTPCERSCQQHTTAITARALHGDSTSVQERPCVRQGTRCDTG